MEYDWRQIRNAFDIGHFIMVENLELGHKMELTAHIKCPRENIFHSSIDDFYLYM